MSIDVFRARAETPGTDHVLHFNNAGAGLMPTCVLDALNGHLQLEAEIGGYEANDRMLAARENVYDAVATLLNADRDEIAIVENATVGWLMAFHSFVRDMKPGDKILTVEAEYAANYVSYLQVAKNTGLVIEVIPSDESGSADVEALKSMMDDRVKLIAVTHVPTNGGLVNPAAEIGAVAKTTGAKYLLDACQSAGQIPLDVDQIGCDALSVTGRKYLRGPRGIGFLYMRKATLLGVEPPLVDHSAAVWTSKDTFDIVPTARRFENWEFYVAGMIALGVAVDYALDWGIENVHARVVKLADQLRASLATIPGVTVTDIGREKCGITTFVKEGHTSADIKAKLAAQNINVSVTHVGSTRIDMERRGLTDMVRASVHYYNDEGEIARFCGAVEAL